MEPAIKTGSIIALQPVTDSSSFKKGDVITFHSVEDPNKLITHRILEVQQVGAGVQYITKGDNNDAKDPKPIPSSHVVGKYTGFTIPYVGILLTFAKSKIGIALLLIVPGFLLIVSQLLSLWRSITSMENDEKPVKGNM
jgi:signal peptidase